MNKYLPEGQESLVEKYQNPMECKGINSCDYDVKKL